MQQQAVEGDSSGARSTGSERSGYPPDLAELRRDVFRRDGYKCRLCGQEGGPQADGDTVELHAHHTVPPAEGGANTLDNLITLCDPCHQRHHSQAQSEDDADAGSGAGGRSVGAFVFTWGTLVLLSFLSVTALSWARGESLVNISPYVTLAGASVLFALSLRLLTKWQQTATAATGAAVGTWAVVYYATDELGTVVGTAEPAATVLVVAAFAALPYVLNRKFDVYL